MANKINTTKFCLELLIIFLLVCKLQVCFIMRLWNESWHSWKCQVEVCPLYFDNLFVFYVSLPLCLEWHTEKLVCGSLPGPWSKWWCRYPRSLCPQYVCSDFKNWSKVNVHWHFCCLKCGIRHFCCIGIAPYQLLFVPPDQVYASSEQPWIKVCHVRMQQSTVLCLPSLDQWEQSKGPSFIYGVCAFSCPSNQGFCSSHPAKWWLDAIHNLSATISLILFYAIVLL